MSDVFLFLLMIAFTLYATRSVLEKAKVPKWVWISIIAYCAVLAVGCFISIFVPKLSERFFYIDTNGSHFRDSFFLAHLPAYYLTVVLFITFIRHRRSLSRNNFIALTSFLVCPILASVTRFFENDIYIVAPATVVSFILMYCFLYLQNSEKLRSQEIMLANNRLAVLQNQIRPHFLYNTLNSIYYLCGKDPSAAQQAIGDFSEYMRANLESLEEDDVIPLEKELDHVDHYLNLEKMRFAGDLSIEYDTDYTDMMIPPMTLQILAENAVKHGIEKKTNGFGKIVIRTRRTTSSDLIMVEDNGVGFDVEEYNDGLGSHVGLGNAKERLRHLLGATLIIESEIGKGTTVTIIIPRNKKKEDKESDQTEE
jgi:signal transduction histidine kinase